MTIRMDHPILPPGHYVAKVQIRAIPVNSSYGFEGAYSYYPAWMDPNGLIYATDRHESIADYSDGDPYADAFRQGFIRLTIGRKELGIHNGQTTFMPTNAQIDAIRELMGRLGQTSMAYTIGTKNGFAKNLDEVIDVVTTPNPFASDNPNDWRF